MHDTQAAATTPILEVVLIFLASLANLNVPKKMMPLHDQGLVYGIECELLHFFLFENTNADGGARTVHWCTV